jgi:hypothetical protein
MQTKPIVVDVYLTLRAVVRAFQNGTLSVRNSLFAFRQAREVVLSDDTDHLLEDLMVDESEYGNAIAAFAAIRAADPPAPQKSRVAWIKNWDEDETSRQGVSFLLGTWGFNPFSIACWDKYYPLGFKDAVQTVLEKSNPGRFRFFA